MLSVIENFKTGKLELADVPSPSARPGFVLVANRASLISAGTERAAIDLAQKTLAGKAVARPDLVRQVVNKVRRDGLAATVKAVRAKLDSPVALGYSCSGIVVEVGRGVDEFAPGDRVACAGAGYATHSDFVSVPKNLCVRIPDGVAFEDAAYVTLGSIAMHGARQSELVFGETALVVGCGLLGLLTVGILSAAGVKVFATDISDSKLDLARRLGAAAAASSRGGSLPGAAAEFTRGEGFDACLITAATKSDEPLRLAGSLARDRGRIVVVGDVGMSIRRRPFYDKELTLVMSRSYGPGRYDPNYEERGVEYPAAFVRWGERRNFGEFLSLVASGKVDVRALTTHVFPIHEALAAYDLVLGKVKEPFIGILLKYNGAAPSRKVVLRQSQQPKPLKRVGIAFIGAGGFAQSVLLPAISGLDGVEPVAIVSAGGLSAGHAGRKFDFNYASTDYETTLGDSAVDAVVVATRHNLHAVQVAAALSAGKHVFVEKPLAIDRSGLATVEQAYGQAHGRILMVGFNRRWSPHAEAVKRFFSGTSRPLTINYRVNAGVVPETSWVQDAAEGGGRVLGEVCHFIDLATYFAGSVPKNVYAVRAGGSGALAEDSDSVTVTVEFANGSVASIVYISAGEPSVSKERVEIAGAGKTAVIEDFRKTFLYENGRVRKVKTAQDKGHRAEMRKFVKSALEGVLPVSLEEVFAVTAATLAVEESLAAGAPVAVEAAG